VRLSQSKGAEGHAANGGWQSRWVFRNSDEIREGAAPEVGAEVAAAKNRGAPPGAASANYAALAGGPMTNEGGVAGLASPSHAGSHQPNTLSEGR
jgi:hypothetical protein